MIVPSADNLMLMLSAGLFVFLTSKPYQSPLMRDMFPAYTPLYVTGMQQPLVRDIPCAVNVATLASIAVLFFAVSVVVYCQMSYHNVLFARMNAPIFLPRNESPSIVFGCVPSLAGKYFEKFDLFQPNVLYRSQTGTWFNLSSFSIAAAK